MASNDRLSVTEVADRLRLNPGTVYRLIGSGEMRSIREGARVFVTENALAAYIELARIEPGSLGYAAMAPPAEGDDE